MLNDYSKNELQSKENKGIVAIFFKSDSIRCMSPDCALKTLINSNEWDFYLYGKTPKDLNDSFFGTGNLFRHDKKLAKRWNQTFCALNQNRCSGFAIA